MWRNHTFAGVPGGWGGPSLGPPVLPRGPLLSLPFPEGLCEATSLFSQNDTTVYLCYSLLANVPLERYSYGNKFWFGRCISPDDASEPACLLCRDGVPPIQRVCSSAGVVAGRNRHLQTLLPSPCIRIPGGADEKWNHLVCIPDSGPAPQH